MYTQVPCAGFRIDLVIIDDDGRRLAVECDGDFHYDDGDLRPEDYHRQDIIERAGWSVFRVSFRRFYANPVAALDRIVEALRNQETESETICRDLEEKLSVGQQEVGRETEETISLHPSDQIAKSTIVMEQHEPLTATGKSTMQEHGKADYSTLGRGPIVVSRNWFTLSSKESRAERPFILKPYDRGFAYNVGKYISRGWTLSSRQVEYAKRMWQMAMEQGFQPPYESELDAVSPNAPSPVAPDPQSLVEDKCIVVQLQPAFQKYPLIPIRAEHRQLFPGFREPFILETDAGNIETWVVGAKNAAIGDPNEGAYLRAGIPEWYRHHHPDLRGGSKVQIQVIDPMRRYRISVLEL